MPNPPRLRAAALTVTAVLLSSALTGCSDDSKDEDLTAQKLSWKDCPAPSESEGGGDAPSPLPGGTPWQCATLKAPLDWAEPKGDTIGIALIRAKTSGDQSKRIGSLVFNFGGPGGSGVTTLPAFGEDYAKLRTRYDLVSFDPRGVGRSAGVKCENDDQLDEYFQQDATPDDAAEQKELAGQHQDVQRGLREELRQDHPARAHHRRGPRHGPDAPGPRRRQAALLRHLVRHRTGRRLRPLVPQERGTCRLRRGRRPDADLGAGLARPGQGLPARARQLRRRLHLEDRGLPGRRHRRRTSRTASRSCSRTSTASRSPASSRASSPRPPRRTASRRRCTPRTSGST